MIPYKKRLKTGFPNGKRIELRITQTKTFVLIDTDRVFDFLKSAPEVDKRTILKKVTFNLKAGQFHIKCDYKQYPKVIQAFTKYLEDLVFASMLEVEKKEDKNVNKNSSNGNNSDSGRNKSSDTTGDNGKDKGKKFKSLLSGVFSGAGGGKPPEGDRADSDSE